MQQLFKNSNYDLKDQTIINNYINKLQQLRMPSTHHKQSFMEFSFSFAILWKTFRTLIFINDLNSTIYVQIAADNFHLSERLQWTQYINNRIQQPSFALACDYLPQKNFTSSPSPPSSSSQQKNRESQSNNLRGNKPQTRNDRFSEITKIPEKGRTPCVFCDLDRHPSQYFMYIDLTFDDKRKLIHAKNLCLIVLDNTW